VSASVLDAIARVLHLDGAERGHLYALATPAPSRAVAPPRQRVRSGLRGLLDSVTDVPALLLGDRSDILAANALACVFYADFEALPIEAHTQATRS
jgi:hypothetical protein